MLASYLRVVGCREEKCVRLLPRCGWVSGDEMCSPPTYVWVDVGRRNVLASYQGVGGCRKENVLASYLGFGGCREEICVSLVPTFGWVSGGEMC